MVEIREEASDDQAASENRQHSSDRSNSNQSQRINKVSFVDFLKAKPLYTTCSILRMVTLFFFLTFFLNAFGIVLVSNSYSKAFAAAAATNAFRLHERLRDTTSAFVSRAFLQQLLLQDSAHYLIYCITFISSPPVTMALFPIQLYALLHISNFTIKAAEATGQTRSQLVAYASMFRLKYTQLCLSTIAVVEIFVFPVFFAMILMGKANFLFVFLYYRFLTLRYASFRNPHTRMAFANLKQSLFDVASKQACPGLVRKFIYYSVDIIQNLAPPVQ